MKSGITPSPPESNTAAPCVAGTLPFYYSGWVTGLYVLLLVLLTLTFSAHRLPGIWMLTGIVAVTAFFGGTPVLSKRWAGLSNRSFIRNLLIASLVIRVVYVVFSYYFYIYFNGQPFEFHAGDALYYVRRSVWLGELLREGDISPFTAKARGNHSKLAYPIYLGLLNVIFGDSVLIPRLIKAIFGALTCFLIYKWASRSFGEPAGRLAGIMMMLMPNLVYYTGLHLKETEMLFLLTAFVERADYVLRARRFTPGLLIVVGLLGCSLFYFRTILAMSAVFALFFALTIAYRQLAVIREKRQLLFWGLALSLLMTVGADTKQASRYFEYVGLVYKGKSVAPFKITGDSRQKKNKSTKRIVVNKMAHYKNAVLIAPLAIVVPFPTMVMIKNHENHMMLNGGYFVKNVLAFFVMIGLWALFKQKLLAQNILVLAFLVAYLGILIFSMFPLSERYHLVALPFLIGLGAYGVGRLNASSRKWYWLYLGTMAMLIVGWNWFKLAGRA